MKSQHLLPILAAATGFAIAWIAKPSVATTNPAPPPAVSSGPKRPTRNDSTRPPVTTERHSVEVKPGDFPLADQADQGPKTREEGKMLRLSEALGLSIDQQGEIIKIVEETKAAATDTVPIISDLTTRGRKVEESLAKILNPEQRAKFEELRTRERENRIEKRALTALAQVIEEIDLSPGQRDEALARLRQAEKERIQAIPAAATLLLNTSVLPTGSGEMSMEGVLTLARLSAPVPVDNPQLAHQQFIQSARQALEEKLRCYDGILSPGQMSQYHAILAEERAILDRIPPPRK